MYLATIWIIPVIIAITFHEAAHGFVAHLLGDDTAWRLGRVSFKDAPAAAFLNGPGMGEPPYPRQRTLDKSASSIPGRLRKNSYTVGTKKACVTPCCRICSPAG